MRKDLAAQANAFSETDGRELGTRRVGLWWEKKGLFPRKRKVRQEFLVSDGKGGVRRDKKGRASPEKRMKKECNLGR